MFPRRNLSRSNAYSANIGWFSLYLSTTFLVLANEIDTVSLFGAFDFPLIALDVT